MRADSLLILSLLLMTSSWSGCTTPPPREIDLISNSAETEAYSPKAWYNFTNENVANTALEIAVEVQERTFLELKAHSRAQWANATFHYVAAVFLNRALEHGIAKAAVAEKGLTTCRAGARNMSDCTPSDLNIGQTVTEMGNALSPGNYSFFFAAFGASTSKLTLNISSSRPLHAIHPSEGRTSLLTFSRENESGLDFNGSVTASLDTPFFAMFRGVGKRVRDPDIEAISAGGLRLAVTSPIGSPLFRDQDNNELHVRGFSGPASEWQFYSEGGVSSDSGPAVIVAAIYHAPSFVLPNGTIREELR